MSTERKMSRRSFIQLTTMVAGAALAACTTPTPAPTAAPKPAEPTKPAAPAATTAPAATAAPAAAGAYNEAPMLADLVKAGKLPAVKDRLPENPCVMNSLDGVGNYGGSMRRAFKGVSDRWGPTKIIDRSLAWFDKNLNLVPRIAESWKVSPDGKEWTIALRKGMKWSDGKPLTSADCKWWWDYEVPNKTVNPGFPSQYSTGPTKTPAKLEVPDANTIKFTFADPNPMFMYKVTRSTPFQPAHYMKEWHIDTTSDKAKLEAAAKTAGSGTWDKYYLDDRMNWYSNPDKPVLGGWVAKGILGKELFIMERNPYFFAVDSKGNQLPYIDTIKHRLFETNDVFDLWIVNGEIDFQGRHVNLGNFTLYKQSETKNDYKVVVGMSAGHLGISINHASKVKRVAEFFQNRNVRIALNLSINRKEINDLIWNGLCKPRQYSPLPTSPQYYAKASNSNIEFDLAKANKLLDEAGYDKKDAQGNRLWKDGSNEVLSIIVEGIDQAGTGSGDTAQAVMQAWAKIGIKGTYKVLERSLYEERYKANEIQAAWWGGDRTVLPLVPEAPIFRGVMMDRPWAGAWGLWKNDPKDANGVEPPKDHFITKIWGIWDKIAVETDPAKQKTLFEGILDIWAEELPMVGVLGEMPALAIAKGGFKGFPAGFPNDDTTGDEQVYNTETYFWDDPKKHNL